jgi:hypothetical protein
MRRLILALAILALSAGPAGAATTPPAAKEPFEVFTIGDSYAAGEGAPDQDGTYNSSGDVVDNQFEDWDTRFGGSPSTPGPNQDSTRCHRTGHTSASASAVERLQTDFPDIFVDWASVACSGASIVQTGDYDNDPPANKGGLLRGYDGAESMSKRGISKDKLSPAIYPPQISQLNTILSNRSGSRKRIDALVMNAGGNDAGFAEVVKICADMVGRQDECVDGNDRMVDFAHAGMEKISPDDGDPGRVDRLAAAIDGHPLSGTGDPSLNTQPGAVFMTAVPLILRPTATTFCGGTPSDNGNEFVQNMTSAEAAWIHRNLNTEMNRRFEREADQHGWRFVDGHVNDFIGHAICESDRFINQNHDGLAKQGRLDEAFSGFDPVPGFNASGGFVHPNKDGYEVIGTALLGQLRTWLAERYTPVRAPQVTTDATASGFDVAVNDNALPDLDSSYWHRIHVRRLGQTTPPAGIEELRDLPYGTTSSHYTTTNQRLLVSVRACAPLSRNGSVGCGPPTGELPVSTFVPDRPVGLDATPGTGFLTSTAAITAGWQHASDLAAFDTRVSQVRVRRKDNLQQVALQNVTAPFTSAVVTGLSGGVDYLVSVRACNDHTRCSAFTSEVTSTAKKGTSPLENNLLQQLNEIKIAVRGVPCLPTPIVFDPGLPAGPGGLKDQFPTVAPTCPGDLPVGKLKLRHRKVTARSGRPARVELTWTTPRRWRDLHEVAIELSGPNGRPVATLRLDEDASKIGLSKGAKRSGRRIRTDRRGTLRVGGLRVRLGRNAVLGSGPRGRTVRLRFDVVTRRTLTLAIGATDDAGVRQPPRPAGVVIARN